MGFRHPEKLFVKGPRGNEHLMEFLRNLLNWVFQLEVKSL